MIIFGVLLAVSASVLGTASKQLLAASSHLNSRKLFYLGFVLNVLVGPILDASAYAFAPQLVIAPFSCLDVILNAVTAPYTLYWQKEKLTHHHIVAVLCVTAGSMITTASAPTTEMVRSMRSLEHQLFYRAEPLAYIGVEMGLLLCLISVYSKHHSAAVRGYSRGVAAGVLVGNVFFVKSLVTVVQIMASEGDLAPLARPTPYVLLACALTGPLMGNMLLQQGLAEYKGVFMVTIFQGAHIFAACLSGCVVMQEMRHASFYITARYWCGVAVILVGMVMLSSAAAEAQLPAGEGLLEDGKGCSYGLQEAVDAAGIEEKVGWENVMGAPFAPIKGARWQHLDGKL